MKVTVGIKARNEETHINAAISSALAAVKPFAGTVVLADSNSRDRTVDIAKTFPVVIVQLVNALEGCCGAGAQLAFQAADCDYFYILDGDMILDEKFLGIGINFLEKNPEFAGVGGRVEEMNIQAYEFQIRAQSPEVSPDRTRIVDRLDCGGLYRVSAIRQVGYFADRNLHAFEEVELATRLAANGWKLARLKEPAVQHFGHSANGYALMWRRFKTGYSGAHGEVLRGAVGRKHFSQVIAALSHIRISIIVMLWWMSIVLSLTLAPSLAIKALLVIVLVALPCGLLSIRRRSWVLGVFSFVSWNFMAIGLIAGFFRKRVSPQKPIDMFILQNSGLTTVEQ